MESNKIMANSLRERKAAAGKARANIGSVVRLRPQKTSEEWEITLVGPDDADPENARLSIECPLGAALLGKQAGETIEVDAPGGQTRYRLLAIRLNE
jgi:transcription elongation factor GreA